MDDGSPPESDALPEGLAGLVKPELQPGERLLWAASALKQPPEGTSSPLASWVIALLSFGIGGGSFYAIFGPPRPRFVSAEGLFIGVGLIASILTLIIVVVAVFATADRWYFHGRFVSNTYALTDRRAIIWVPQRNSKAIEVTAFPRGSIKALHRLEYPDGTGSVRFGFGYSDGEHHYGPSGFEGVADVRQVEDMVRRTLIDPAPIGST